MYISYVYVLLVVSTRHSYAIADLAFLCGSFSLLRFDKLLRVIDRSHDVVIARLLHHLLVRVQRRMILLSLQLAVGAAAGTVIVYSW